MKKITLYQKLKKDFPAVPEKELYAQILCGEVLVDEQIIRDPKFPVDTETGIILNPKKYVSRGGFKLEKAIELWKPSLEGRIVLDAGCSTGGFTDCLLKNGAASVYAVDVGYNQLDYSLRTNPSVVVMEKTNIMHVQDLDPRPDWAVADLSFRSIRSAASHILSLTKEKFLIALVKPQFEWQNPDEDFSGVVSDKDQILEIAAEVMDELKEESAYVLKAGTSPVSGRKGNRELLFWISSDENLVYPEKEELLLSLSRELK